MIKVEGIVWDTDGKNANLPSEIVIPDMDFDDVMDYLSDQYGWCVHTVRDMYYVEANDEYWKCQWCDKLVYNTDGKVEVEMGFLCDTCIRAIESRGEKLYFLDDEVFD
ncbi:MAG TPA: hypothetical protein PKK61_02990 [Defluviitaleaceae bacterium]|nr:hypothetical protein [Defluviitaleaceae bacterium]